MKQETEFSLNDLLFVALVRDFESMAMVGFGKLLDPVSQSADRNLERAKVAIDMLGMLEQKTKGNLLYSEASLLQQILTNLRLNYVDELEKDKKGRTESPEEGEKAQEPSEGAAAAGKRAGGAEKEGKAARKRVPREKGTAPAGSKSKSQTDKKTARRNGAVEGKDGSGK